MFERSYENHILLIVTRVHFLNTSLNSYLSMDKSSRLTDLPYITLLFLSSSCTTVSRELISSNPSYRNHNMLPKWSFPNWNGPSVRLQSYADTHNVNQQLARRLYIYCAREWDKKKISTVRWSFETFRDHSPGRPDVFPTLAIVWGPISYGLTAVDRNITT